MHCSLMQTNISYRAQVAAVRSSVITNLTCMFSSKAPTNTDSAFSADFPLSWKDLATEKNKLHAFKKNVIEGANEECKLSNNNQLIVVSSYQSIKFISRFLSTKCHLSHVFVCIKCILIFLCVHQIRNRSRASDALMWAGRKLWLKKINYQ